jgi:cytochrome c-type biogenesis protein CcmH/NrfF
MTRRLVLAFLAVAALLPAGALAATPQTSLNDIEDEVMCVVCGVPLNIAESPQADRERALINQLIVEGRTKAQIKQELVAQYGSGVLANPDDHGANVTNWLVPLLVVLALLAGVGVLAPRWIRRQRASGAGAPATNPAVPDLSPDDQRRLDEDLGRYR